MHTIYPEDYPNKEDTTPKPKQADKRGFIISLFCIAIVLIVILCLFFHH